MDAKKLVCGQPRDYGLCSELKPCDICIDFIESKGELTILDVCCGGRMFWFNKKDPNTLYIDIRTAEKGHIGNGFNPNHEVRPDRIMDFRDLKLPDKSFKLVVFDPPHLKTLTETSVMRRKYGCLNAETWQADLKKGFSECWRVLEDYGTLVFKWNEVEIPFSKVLDLFPERPKFGHPTAKHGKTMWCIFFKNTTEDGIPPKL